MGLMATYSSILTWRIPWTEESGKLQSRGWKTAGHNWPTDTFTFTFKVVVRCGEKKSAPVIKCQSFSEHVSVDYKFQKYFSFFFLFSPSLGGAMASHSSILAWRIPWTEELGGLQSTRSQAVGHDWATSLSLSLRWSRVARGGWSWLFPFSQVS